MNMNVNIKKWYMENYPTDEMGYELNEDVDFDDLFMTLDNYGDVYELLGVYDSLIRERVFGKLSELMNVDYSYIYEQWLKG